MTIGFGRLFFEGKVKRAPKEIDSLRSYIGVPPPDGGAEFSSK